MIDCETLEASPNSHRLEKIGESKPPNLESFLPKAKTPQRKNKTNVKRSSFVITSSAYKKEMEGKKLIQEEIERRKEENRQKRLKKKLEKEAKSKQARKSKAEEKHPTQENKAETGKTRPEQKENTDEESLEGNNNIWRKSGLCFSCGSDTSSKKIGVKCQDCNRVYHIACLEKRGLFKDFYRCGICTVKQSMRL